jgi:hypothetical protein
LICSKNVIPENGRIYYEYEKIFMTINEFEILTGYIDPRTINPIDVLT